MSILLVEISNNGLIIARKIIKEVSKLLKLLDSSFLVGKFEEFLNWKVKNISLKNES